MAKARIAHACDTPGECEGVSRVTGHIRFSVGTNYDVSNSFLAHNYGKKSAVARYAFICN